MSVLSFAAVAAGALLLQASPVEVRSLTVSVTDAKDAPVQGIEASEVAVMEDGVAREVVKVEPDRRPLTLAVLIDTSQAVGSEYRLNMVDAITGFLSHLPEGARYTLWTTGDRPTHLVELTDDPSLAAPALKRVVPQGGNTILDALVEASRELKSSEGGPRRLVVAITGLDTEFSNRERHQVVEQALATGAQFAAVQFDAGDIGFDDRARYEYVLSTITKESGGGYETLLSPMALRDALQRIGRGLAAQYRVVYAAAAGRSKHPKLEVKIARPDVKVRISQPAADKAEKP
jgi:VWFA-related protein